jgi:hypothetical protein
MLSKVIGAQIARPDTGACKLKIAGNNSYNSLIYSFQRQGRNR